MKLLNKAVAILKKLHSKYAKVEIFGYTIDLRTFWKRLFWIEKYALRKRQKHTLNVHDSRFGFKLTIRKKE